MLWALSLWWFDRNLPLILGLGLLAWAVETLVNTFLIPMEALPPATFGTLDTATLAEFFRELALAAGFTLHLDILKAGPNPQQLLAVLFKACGRALRAACTIDRRAAARGE